MIAGVEGVASQVMPIRFLMITSVWLTCENFGGRCLIRGIGGDPTFSAVGSGSFTAIGEWAADALRRAG